MVLSRVPVGLLSVLALGSCNTGADDCTEGSAGCECLLGTCEAGLVCGPQGVCVYPGGDGGGDGGDDGDGLPGANEPPVVESLTHTPDLLDEGSTLIVTATVTDPDGPDDVATGSATRTDNGMPVGTFIDQGDGTWQLSTGWDVIVASGSVGDGPVRIQATFVDSVGNIGDEVTDISACDYYKTACGTTCADLDDDERHCGSCGTQCVPEAGCVDGVCCVYDYYVPCPGYGDDALTLVDRSIPMPDGMLPLQTVGPAGIERESASMPLPEEIREAFDIPHVPARGARP